MPRLNFARHSYQSPSKPLSSQQLINFYAEQEPQDAKEPLAVFGTAGLREWVDLGSEPIYNLIFTNDKAYAVSGGDVYEINSTGEASRLGSIGTNTGIVTSAFNGTEICYVKSDNTGYILNTTTKIITQITDADFDNGDTVTYQQSYFIFNKADTQQMFHSAIFDGLSYNAADVASAENNPDNVIRVFADHNELWAFGTESIEVWINAANPVGFVFSLLSGGVLERGCAAKFSVAKEDNTLFWLGDDRVIYRANGYTPQRISTHAIEATLSGYGTIDDAISFFFTERGHKFYCLTFPTEDATWVYDIATNMWHQRQSKGMGRWRPNAHTFGFSKNIFGDSQNGKLYELDHTYFKEGADLILRTATLPNLFSQGKRFIVDRFELEMDVGFGDTTGTYEDPQIALDYSKDGGYTWSNEHWRSVGKKGNYKKRVIWRRLGQAKQVTYRLKMADPVQSVLLSAYADVRAGKE